MVFARMLIIPVQFVEAPVKTVTVFAKMKIVQITEQVTVKMQPMLVRTRQMLAKTQRVLMEETVILLAIRELVTDAETLTVMGMAT